MSNNLDKYLTQYNMGDLVAEAPPNPHPRNGASTANIQNAREEPSKAKKKRKRPASPIRPGASHRLGLRTHDNWKMKSGSPWDRYRKVYELKLDMVVSIAIHKDQPCDLVSVKAFKQTDAHSKLHMLHAIRNDSFVRFLESFSLDNTVYTVLESMSITLDQIVACPAYPGEPELAAILGQIIYGLIYLESLGLKHGAMSCSSILLNNVGEVKIAGQESCMEVESSRASDTEDIRALGNIMMKLMQKYSRSDSMVGVEDLDRWDLSSNAVGFLSATTSAKSAEDLMQHPLLQAEWSKEDLKWMVALAQVSAYRFYKYEL